MPNIIVVYNKTIIFDYIKIIFLFISSPLISTISKIKFISFVRTNILVFKLIII